MNEPNASAPITEPDNSTVNDWHGQEVQRDVEVADRVLEEAGGDMARAEQLFEEERPEHPSDRYKVDPDEREGTLDSAPSDEQRGAREAAASHDREDAPPV